MNNNESIPMVQIPTRALLLLIASVAVAVGPWLLRADARTIIGGVLIAVAGVVYAAVDWWRKTQ